jgi:hypothetical protein
MYAWMYVSVCVRGKQGAVSGCTCSPHPTCPCVQFNGWSNEIRTTTTDYCYEDKKGWQVGSCKGQAPLRAPPPYTQAHHSHPPSSVALSACMDPPTPYVGITVVMRVTLLDGCFHEDLGFGQGVCACMDVCVMCARVAGKQDPQAPSRFMYPLSPPSAPSPPSHRHPRITHPTVPRPQRAMASTAEKHCPTLRRPQ